LEAIFERQFQIFGTTAFVTHTFNKKARLTLSNPRDVKACQNCSNSTNRIPFPQIANA